MAAFSVTVYDQDAAPQPGGQIWQRQCLQMLRDASWYLLVHKEVMQRLDRTVWWVRHPGREDIEIGLVTTTVMDNDSLTLRLLEDYEGSRFDDGSKPLRGSGYRLLALVEPPAELRVNRALTPGSVSDLSVDGAPCQGSSPQEPAK